VGEGSCPQFAQDGRTGESGNHYITISHRLTKYIPHTTYYMLHPSISPLPPPSTNLALFIYLPSGRGGGGVAGGYSTQPQGVYVIVKAKQLNLYNAQWYQNTLLGIYKKNLKLLFIWILLTATI